MIPAVGKARAIKVPTSAERTLANGLRVLAVRRAGVPLVELRLRVPFAGRQDSHLARANLLSASLLAGTAERSNSELAEALQAIGGSLSAGVDADRLAIGGSALSARLPELLGLLGEVLMSAAYPRRDVEGERDRLAQEVLIARSQPHVLAGEALLHRMYGAHPYGRDLPTVEEVESVTPGNLRSMHSRRVVATGATLVLVGDLTPARALDRAEAALAEWSAGTRAPGLPRLPAHTTGPIRLVDRPDAVQTSIRLGAPALPRQHEDFPALQLANIIFGGYFSSRLVANIREDKGYTYSPHSSVEHPSLGSRLVVDADVATAVTAPALLEIRYELGRIATVQVTPDELEAARRYAVGSLALSTASQAGLASTLSMLVGAGLGIDYLRDQPRRLEEVTSERLLQVARTHLAPASFITVLLGDAGKVQAGVAALDAVDVQ